MEGAPALTASAVQAFQRCADIVGHAFVDWHATQREMLVAHRAQVSSTPQLFRLRSPPTVLEPLTSGPERVTDAEWEPERGRSIVFERDIGGNEAEQVYRLDPDTKATTRLTADGERHGLAGWSRSRGAWRPGQDRSRPRAWT